MLGANGAALGLLCAWLVDDRLAARRGDERENDLIGVYVVGGRARAALARRDRGEHRRPRWAAPLAGALLGLALPLFTRKSAF